MACFIKRGREIKSSVIESSVALKKMGRGTKKRAKAEAEHFALLDNAEERMSALKPSKKQVIVRVSQDKNSTGAASCKARRKRA